MRFHLLLSFLALATCQENQHDQQILNDEEYLVPGSNPFTYCTNPKPYVMQISELNFTLSEPKNSTRNMSISLDTHLIQTIEDGSQLQIQMGMTLNGSLVPIDDQTLDLCEELERNWDVECPVKSGVQTRERNLTLYGGIPGVVYVIVLNAWTKDEERITCLQGKLEF